MKPQTQQSPKKPAQPELPQQTATRERPSGKSATERAPIDEVDEASMESFPASDPPATRAHHGR